MHLSLPGKLWVSSLIVIEAIQKVSFPIKTFFKTPVIATGHREAIYIYIFHSVICIFYILTSEIGMWLVSDIHRNLPGILFFKEMFLLR